MKRQSHRIAIWVFVIAAVLIPIGLLKGLSASDWASWVQAIGSISAILGAFWLTELQVLASRRLDGERELREELRKSLLIRVVAQEAREACEMMADAFEEPTPYHVPHTARRLANLEKIIRDLPMFDMPNQVLALAALRTPDALRLLSENVQTYLEEMEKAQADESITLRARCEFDGLRSQALSHAAAMEKFCDDQLDLIKELIQQLAGTKPPATLGNPE